MSVQTFNCWNCVSSWIKNNNKSCNCLVDDLNPIIPPNSSFTRHKNRFKSQAIDTLINLGGERLGSIDSFVNILDLNNGFSELSHSFVPNNDSHISLISPNTLSEQQSAQNDFVKQSQEKVYSFKNKIKSYSNINKNIKDSTAFLSNQCRDIRSEFSKNSLFYTNAPHSLVGKSIAFGDFSGNGKTQIGAPFYFSPSHKSQAGAVFVSDLDSLNDPNHEYQVESFAKLTLYLPDSTPLSNNHSFSQIDKFSMFGASLLSIDINGDGIDDLVVGAPWTNGMMAKNRGKVLIYYGRKNFGLNSVPDQVIDSDNIGTHKIGDFKLSGVRIGEHLFPGNFGNFDLIIGAPQTNLDKKLQAGAVFVFSMDQKSENSFLALKSASVGISPSNYDWYGASAVTFKDPKSSSMGVLIVGSPGHRPPTDNIKILDYHPSNDFQTNEKSNKMGKVYGYSVFSNYSINLETEIGDYGSYGMFGSHLALSNQDSQTNYIIISAHLSDITTVDDNQNNSNGVANVNEVYVGSDSTPNLKTTPVRMFSTLWQAGSIYATNWSLIDVEKKDLFVDIFNKINAASSLSHLGSSTSCIDSECWIGEPLSNKRKAFKNHHLFSNSLYRFLKLTTIFY
ncbi:Phosphatidylinositol-glycan-specific phospholipase D [Smittium mucronatum]|uniref:Phosphatidylinositol-glycan-specific phospholipase D n=1 Tax=Smittium mucronatum TaxID=133383 RepID=A0A1R0H7I3_9FUNG|nr:Phosphatidylinositol-glycan-specific phospholipase D [Smittium mucronatum]